MRAGEIRAREAKSNRLLFENAQGIFDEEIRLPKDLFLGRWSYQ